MNWLLLHLMHTKTNPEAGQIVKVRTRTWLVDGVEAEAPSSFTVDLACLDDDAQGEKLSVAWELELDGSIVSTEAWKDIGKKGVMKIGAVSSEAVWVTVFTTLAMTALKHSRFPGLDLKI